MRIFLLLAALHLVCQPGLNWVWDHGKSTPESDLLGYWIPSAERHVVEWVECPCPDIGVPCLITYCPVYNPFQWDWTFTGWITRFVRDDCADVPYSVCYYKHPYAEDTSGLLSFWQPLLWPPPLGGGCP